MNRFSVKGVVTVAAGCLLLIAATAAVASDAVRVLVNGNNQEQAVHINAQEVPEVTRDLVISWIKAQGRDQVDSYFWEGLSIRTANLDQDDDLEVVAVIDGAVHLGTWFLFDRQPDGQYKLIAETDWKADRLVLEDPIEIADNKLFEVVQSDGGTGVHVETAHLYYLEQEKLVEAWQGVLEEKTATMGVYRSIMGGYRVDESDFLLYAWQTVTLLEEDMVTVKGKRQTEMSIYAFDGTRFTAVPMK